MIRLEQGTTGGGNGTTALDTSPKYWSKPAEGWFKVDVDAAKFEEINCIGVEAVIRNDQGAFV